MPATPGWSTRATTPPCTAMRMRGLTTTARPTATPWSHPYTCATASKAWGWAARSTTPCLTSWARPPATWCWARSPCPTPPAWPCTMRWASSRWAPARGRLQVRPMDRHRHFRETPGMNTMYTLYVANKNYSSWSLRPWLLMTELGLPFEEKLVPFGQVAFTSFAPNGKVPCLHDQGTIVWDSLAITEYLAERHPGVWPTDASARAWARCASAEMH